MSQHQRLVCGGYVYFKIFYALQAELTLSSRSSFGFAAPILSDLTPLLAILLRSLESIIRLDVRLFKTLVES
jgi:hypothetical protein